MLKVNDFSHFFILNIISLAGECLLYLMPLHPLRGVVNALYFFFVLTAIKTCPDRGVDKLLHTQPPDTDWRWGLPPRENDYLASKYLRKWKDFIMKGKHLRIRQIWIVVLSPTLAKCNLKKVITLAFRLAHLQNGDDNTNSNIVSVN